MVYYNFSLFQSTIYLEENIEIITFFCYTAIVYIYAIQEVNVYLYIAVGKNFEKNSLFVLTRSGNKEYASCSKNSSNTENRTPIGRRTSGKNEKGLIFLEKPAVSKSPGSAYSSGFDGGPDFGLAIELYKFFPQEIFCFGISQSGTVSHCASALASSSLWCPLFLIPFFQFPIFLEPVI